MLASFCVFLPPLVDALILPVDGIHPLGVLFLLVLDDDLLLFASSTIHVLVYNSSSISSNSNSNSSNSNSNSSNSSSSSSTSSSSTSINVTFFSYPLRAAVALVPSFR